MEYPIAEKNDAIRFLPAEIVFNDYDYLLQRAKNVAEVINNTPLTEDNVAEVKQTLANARKVTNGLDTARKDLKKMVMGNFNEIEEKIKYIISVIDDADETLRDKVRALEEAERQEKRKTIFEIWEKRLIHYMFPKYIPDAFDRWIQPKHLNKTATMKAVESDMVKFMETTENDLLTLSALDDEFVAEYCSVLDVTRAINNVNERRDALSKIKATDQAAESVATFTIRGNLEIKLVEMFLKENNITFERK